MSEATERIAHALECTAPLCRKCSGIGRELARKEIRDTEILDWMAREGLESIVRVPQFDRDGNSLGICLWASLWERGIHYVSLRGAAIAGMMAAKKRTSGGVTE